MVDLAEADPGRAWRRLARAGAAVATLLAMYAFYLWPPGDMWVGFVDFLHAEPKTSYQYSSPYKYYLLVGLRCFIHLAQLEGPVFCLACSPRVLKPGLGRLPHLVAVLAVSFLAVAAGYVIGLVHLNFAHGLSVTVSLGMPSLFLFLVGLAFLAGWHHRGTAMLVFWWGVFPLAAGGAAWTCDLVLSIIGVEDRLMSGIGFTAFAMMAVGWLLWWRAVRRAIAKDQASQNE